LVHKVILDIKESVAHKEIKGILVHKEVQVYKDLTDLHQIGIS
jgi:hypothetical protein